MRDIKFTLKDLEHPLDTATAKALSTFWIEEEAPVDDIDTRLKEARLLALVDGKIAGVATAYLTTPKALGCPVYAVRTFVGKAFRRSRGAHLLTKAFVEKAEELFNTSADISALGVMASVEVAHIASGDPVACRWGYPHEDGTPHIEFNLFKLTRDGRPQYVHFFEHASLFADGPVVESKIDRIDGADDSLRLTFALGSLSEPDAQQVLGLWLGNGVMETREAALQRLPQVAALAWQGDRIVGVASVFEVPHEPVNAKFFGFRSFISPEARGGSAATRLLNLVFDNLEQKIEAGAISADFHGVAYVLQNERLNKQVHKPMGPNLRSVFIGYLNDMQLRVKYFKSAKISTESNQH